MPVVDDLYVLTPGEGDPDDEGWITPRPVEEGIVAAVAAETDLDADDVDDVTEYVDLDDVASVLESDDETVTFAVEGHDVFVDERGHVSVDTA